MGLAQTEEDSRFSVYIPDKGRSEGVIRWNPTEGLETPKGALSPATILEHEMDHGVHWETNTSEHIKNKKMQDAHFTNKEEKRVITGSEYSTGVANGELKVIPPNGLNKDSSYRSHRGNTFIKVISPISNKKKI